MMWRLQIAAIHWNDWCKCKHQNESYINLCPFLTCTDCQELPRCFSHSVSDANWPFFFGYKPGGFGYKPGGGGNTFRPNGPCCWCGVWMLCPKTWGLGKGPIVPISASFLRFAMLSMAGKGSKNMNLNIVIQIHLLEKGSKTTRLTDPSIKSSSSSRSTMAKWLEMNNPVEMPQQLSAMDPNKERNARSSFAT